MNPLNAAQFQAVQARGNVLVVAGAGAGKTLTLVQRCLHWLLPENGAGSLDQMLLVTFTEAAATELKRRIREGLEELARQRPSELHLSSQVALLETAAIGTLHGFCLQLIRHHFYELGLDPQVSVLAEEQARLIAQNSFQELLDARLSGETAEARLVQDLIQSRGPRGAELLRELVLRIHVYAQTWPDPEKWFESQEELLNDPNPHQWETWWAQELARWQNEWFQLLTPHAAGNDHAARALSLLGPLTLTTDRLAAGPLLESLVALDQNWPARKKGVLRQPLQRMFEEARFLGSLCPQPGRADPLREDWLWLRPHNQALLRLAREFGEEYGKNKRDLSALDFQDLEQFALRLLWDRTQSPAIPTATAALWREKFQRLFVDEYQDINPAQDAILQALAGQDGQGNRFLVGDVKQSIYRFRLANPGIFLNYSRLWKEPGRGEVIHLSENFRSHESLLHCLNTLFAALMHDSIGGLSYTEESWLRLGDREHRSHFATETDPAPRVELHVRVVGNSRDPHPEQDPDADTEPQQEPEEEEGAEAALNRLSHLEKEARLVGLRLLELLQQQWLVWEEGTQRPVAWKDMVILLRSPRHKAESYARELERLGIPLLVSRGGFYDSLEVTDLLSLLQLLDNPLQDLPLLAVLRSPLVGLSLNDLASVRLASPRGRFWTALQEFHQQNQHPSRGLVDLFLHRFRHWRRLVRQQSLSHCLESILAETHYQSWLLTQPRGAQRVATVERFLGLTRQFDLFHREGLFRFIRFVQAQQENEVQTEPAPASTDNAVRLMSIHQSKGLEFPVVVLADLGKAFNFSEASRELILDEGLGLCTLIKSPDHSPSYPSLPHWLAQRRQRLEVLGEELRLLYVATTRASQRLLLFGTTTLKTVTERWSSLPLPAAVAEARQVLDWIGAWIQPIPCSLEQRTGVNALFSWAFYEDQDARLLLPTASPSSAPALGGPALTHLGLKKLRQQLDWKYPFLPATHEPAKTHLSALARNNGLAQRFLRLVDLEQTGSEATLRQEAARLAARRLLMESDVEKINFGLLAHFWQSEAGRQIRASAPRVRRHLSFTARFSPEELQQSQLSTNPTAGPDAFILVEGVVDLVVIEPGELWVMAFRMEEFEAPLARELSQQWALHAVALSRIYRRPVTRHWIHFLPGNRTLELSATGIL